MSNDNATDNGQSSPEYPAQGECVGAVVYFSSVSNNTTRFMEACQLWTLGLDVYRIPLRPQDGALSVRQPYVLVVPTYGGGNPQKALPPQVKKFLNDPANRAGLRGVIAAGNTNFGEAFCAAGDIISRKTGVPYLYHFELMGTPEDVTKVREGLVKFFTDYPEPAPTAAPAQAQTQLQVA